MSRYYEWIRFEGYVKVIVHEQQWIRFEGYIKVIVQPQHLILPSRMWNSLARWRGIVGSISFWTTQLCKGLIFHCFDATTICLDPRSKYEQTSRLRSKQTYALGVRITTFCVYTKFQFHSICGATLMEIDEAHHRGPMSKIKKQQCRTNQLFLYCGGLGHVQIHCPHCPRPKKWIK